MLIDFWIFLIDDIFESMLYVNNADSYSEETSIIDNPQVIQDILKICGYRFRTISKIDDSIIIEKEVRVYFIRF